MLLDINMPGMGGLAACKAIRADTNIAIIMLTVRNSENDKVEALDAGADDFVTKPFSTPELLARIRAALRRVPAAPQSSPDRIRAGRLVIDFAARTVPNGSHDLHLTPKELDLLRYLTQHANEGGAASGTAAGRLGPGLRRPGGLPSRLHQEPAEEDRAESGQPEYITTEPWVGYRFNARPESE